MNRALPKVSVITITYGHEKYIRETLDGVLMQQYDGPVEFIIANDNSPDATDEVVKKYFLENPAPSNFEIKYTKHETNKGMIPNFIWALEQATGKYIALCEGDDFWIDIYKLQKQYEFLRDNINYSIHSGLVETIEKGRSRVIGSGNSSFKLADFFTQNNLVTCTVMFRKTDIQNIYYKDLIFADWMLYINILKRNSNKAYVSDKILSKYRVHEGGIMSSLKGSLYYECHLKQIFRIKKVVRPNYSKDDLNRINTHFIVLFKSYLHEKKYIKALLITSKNLLFFPSSAYWKSYVYFLINHFKCTP